MGLPDQSNESVAQPAAMDRLAPKLHARGVLSGGPARVGVRGHQQRRAEKSPPPLRSSVPPEPGGKCDFYSNACALQLRVAEGSSACKNGTKFDGGARCGPGRLHCRHCSGSLLVFRKHFRQRFSFSVPCTIRFSRPSSREFAFATSYRLYRHFMTPTRS